jgi:hypothetical protein
MMLNALGNPLRVYPQPLSPGTKRGHSEGSERALVELRASVAAATRFCGELYAQSLEVDDELYDRWISIEDPVTPKPD